MWRHASRVDAHCSARLGTRSTTVALGPLDDPIGWCAVRWRPPPDEFGLIHRVGWNEAAGRTPADAWRAIADLVGTPVAPTLVATGDRLSSSAA